MLLAKISSGIDLINIWIGRLTSWLVLILALLNFYEVFMRYAFNRPSIWAYDLSYMIGGTFFTLGMGYTLLKKKHVRVDVFYNNFKKRKKAITDICLTVLVFFPTFTLLLIKLIPWVQTSWERKEKATGSYWLPPIYPFKTIMLVAVILLILQVISEFIKDCLSLVNTNKGGGDTGDRT